ncbi:Mitoferrin [Galdieria sulphuraria]|nr:Mitoferrin [Galdieria sulphuraria]
MTAYENDQNVSKRRRETSTLEPEDDEDLTAWEHMTAGAAAGMAEHSVMYPVDTIKTRMQSYMSALDMKQSIFRAVHSIILHEGVSRLWRGVSAVLISAGPAHAVYFATYEAAKEAFGGNKNSQHHPLATSAAGGLATIVADGMMAPFDVVKQRMQLKSSCYSNIFHCISTVYRQHGTSAFFVGYKTTLIMNVPFTAIHFTVYESCKKVIHKWRNIASDELSVTSQLLAGAMAGACASAVTNPFDVVRTRLQTQGERGARRYKNMTSAMKSIYYEEGIRGFLHGIRPRILFHMPAAAICFTVYATCKHVLYSGKTSKQLQTEEDHIL